MVRWGLLYPQGWLAQRHDCLRIMSKLPTQPHCAGSREHNHLDSWCLCVRCAYVAGLHSSYPTCSSVVQQVVCHSFSEPPCPNSYSPIRSTGAAHAFVTNRSRPFDLVLLDEACQVSLPLALGPLLAGAKFVLVGDPQQLPPLVASPLARERGLGTSLFEILQAKHP